jgi:hypothetical protein
MDALKRPRDTFETLSPIYKLLKVFGLAAVVREKGGLKVTWNPSKTVAPVILTLMTILTLIMKIINFLLCSSPDRKLVFTDTIQITYLFGYLHYIIDVICVRKFGTEVSIKYLKLYDHFDFTLGNAYYLVVKKKVKNITICVLLSGITLMIVDFLGWAVNYDLKIPLLYSPEYVFFLLNLLIIIGICSHVVQIEYRLKTIGDIARELYSSAYNEENMLDDVVDDKNWLYSREEKFKQHINKKQVYPKDCDKIGLLKRCYLLLIEQSNYINTSFGFTVSNQNYSKVIKI